MPQWLVIGPAAAIEAAAAILTVRWYRGIDCYLSRLSGPERQRAAGRRLRALRDSAGLWLVIVIIALIVGFSLRFPPRTLNQWADDSTLVILAIWPLLDAVDYVISARWRRRLSAAAI